MFLFVLKKKEETQTTHYIINMQYVMLAKTYNVKLESDHTRVTPNKKKVILPVSIPN